MRQMFAIHNDTFFLRIVYILLAEITGLFAKSVFGTFVGSDIIEADAARMTMMNRRRFGRFHATESAIVAMVDRMMRPDIASWTIRPVEGCHTVGIDALIGRRLTCMTFFAFDFGDLDRWRTIRRIGFMTTDTGIDTFATGESEFMTLFAFGIVGAGVIQVILVGVLGCWVLLWMEDFLDFAGFLFFGQRRIGVDLADFLTGFFVHVVGFWFEVSYRFIFSILFMFGFVLLICYW